MLKVKLTILAISAVCCCAAESASWSDRAPLIRTDACEGLPLSLTCRKPPPGRIGWFKTTDTNELLQINADHRIKTDVNGTLQFSCVDVTDTAVYKCSVSGSSTITLGSQVNLTVIKVETAYRDKEQITKTACVTQSNSSRTVKTVSKEDTGTFQCIDKGTVVSTTDVTTLNEVDLATSMYSTSSLEEDGTTATSVPAPACSWPSALNGALVGIIIVLVLIGTIGVVLIRRMKKSDNPLSCPGKEDGGIQRGQATPSTSSPTYGTHVLES